jgi:deazaflavin-dependent oxidoreductase (nitroreductase family)
MVGQQPNWLQRMLHWIPASRTGAWFFARTLHYIDRPLLRITRGQISLAGLLSGLPVVTLTTTGAKSGKPRSVPLVGMEDGDKLVLIASWYGRPQHPAWYHNLRRNPEVVVALRGTMGTYIAGEVTGEARAEYWRRAVALYRGFAAYQQRAGGRIIPIVVLTPKPRDSLP